MKFKRWFRNWCKILNDIFSYLGLFWLIVSIASYFTGGEIDVYLINVPAFTTAFMIIILGSFYKNRPKISFEYKLRNKDNYIEVKVGDAFSNNGALIIPFNDEFDVSLNGNVKKTKSLQNKLIDDFYAGKEDHLSKDISNIVTLDKKYEIGTTIEIEQCGKKFYLLVNSRKKENNRVESTTDDFLLCLSKVWEYIALNSGRNDSITIPVIGTQHGRITQINRSSAIKEIIRSYVESSKCLNVCDKLTISIHPDDLKKGAIDLDEIDEYLKYACKHYRVVEFETKPEGKEISASDVKNIIN
jgi:hypothetical protein